MVRKVPISQVKENPSNPRIIKSDKFQKLVRSIKEFPQMLELRPIVIDEEGFALGGNMRLKACKEAGLEEVWIMEVSDLTESQKKEFVIKDNLAYGIWDWETLSSEEWNLEELNNWAIDAPGWIYTNDISSLDLDGLADVSSEETPEPTTRLLKVKFTSEEFPNILSALAELDQIPEQAVLKLLNITPDETSQD